MKTATVTPIQKETILQKADELGLEISGSIHSYPTLVILKNPTILASLQKDLYDMNISEEVTPELFLQLLSEFAPDTVKSDGGGGRNYYDLPEDTTQLIDLIEHRNMNGNVKDVFKACYRLGQKDGAKDEYDLRKMAFYSLRELGRVTGRKDYLNLAEEVIGHHDLTGATVVQK